MFYDEFRQKNNHLFTTLTNNVVINSIYERILQSGLHYPVYDLLFFNKQFDYEKTHPTEEMKLSSIFFRDHSGDVQKCIELLEDDTSKMVFGQIIRFRCTHDRVCFPSHCTNNQYFPKDIIELRPNEVFLDCGACKGDTYRRLRRESHNRFKKAVLFEVDDDNIKFIKKTTQKDPRVELIEKAVWSENTRIFFEDMNTDGSGYCIQDVNGYEGTVREVKACSIDTQDCCRDATFIKMDIEGSEWEALHGARETIKRNHPKLAICLYHNDLDYIRIIPFIHSLNPDYKLFVRHHSTNLSETVLYAI